MQHTLRITAQGTDIFTQLWVAALNEVIAKLIEAIALKQALNALGGFLGGLFNFALGIFGIHLQHGGPIRAGQPAIVGEAGPELFVPGQSGTVLPNRMLLGMGGVTIINATFTGPVMGDELQAREFSRRIGKLLRQEGRRR